MVSGTYIMEKSHLPLVLARVILLDSHPAATAAHQQEAAAHDADTPDIAPVIASH